MGSLFVNLVLFDGEDIILQQKSVSLNQLPLFKIESVAEYSLGEALNEFLKKSRLKGDIQALQIDDVWEEIMGKTVARYTDKLQIIGDKLFITTTVAPLKHELMYQRDKIAQRVNEKLGRNIVKEVVIK